MNQVVLESKILAIQEKLKFKPAITYSKDVGTYVLSPKFGRFIDIEKDCLERQTVNAIVARIKAFGKRDTLRLTNRDF